MVVQTTIDTANYVYNGKLEYGINYFWRVRVLELEHQPIPSSWSATFSFTTKQASPPSTSADDTWTWIIAAISILLAVVIIVLITVRRKTLHR